MYQAIILLCALNEPCKEIESYWTEPTSEACIMRVISDLPAFAHFGYIMDYKCVEVHDT